MKKVFFKCEETIRSNAIDQDIDPANVGDERCYEPVDLRHLAQVGSVSSSLAARPLDLADDGFGFGNV
jgi:hypothetical protein